MVSKLQAYKCPICDLDGFTTEYDLERHSLAAHGRRTDDDRGRGHHKSLAYTPARRPRVDKTVEQLADELVEQAMAQGIKYNQLLSLVGYRMIVRTVDYFKSRSAASRWLHISRNTLTNKLKGER
jgi:hypothetical protein